MLCSEGKWGKHTAECRDECGPLDLTQRHVLNGSKGLLLGQGAGTGWGGTLPARCEPGWAPSGKKRWDPVLEKLYRGEMRCEEGVWAMGSANCTRICSPTDSAGTFGIKGLLGGIGGGTFVLGYFSPLCSDGYDPTGHLRCVPPPGADLTVVPFWAPHTAACSETPCTTTTERDNLLFKMNVSGIAVGIGAEPSTPSRELVR